MEQYTDKKCSPDTCHRTEIKDGFYDFQKEKFELQKSLSTPDELKGYIAERRKYLINEMQRLFPEMENNQNAKCLYEQSLWLLDLYKEEAEKLSDNKPNKSFSWTGSPKQLEALCQALKDAGYIDPKTTKEAFIAIFSGIDIDINFKRVTWICVNRKGTVNKTALREFLNLLMDKFQKNTVPLCFVDKLGNPISLNKPKNNEYSNYYTELSEIVQKVKQLPDL